MRSRRGKGYGRGNIDRRGRGRGGGLGSLERVGFGKKGSKQGGGAESDSPE
jgi:hypothetical protein